MNIEDEDYIGSLIDPSDGVAPIEIDVDQIEQESKDYVVQMVENLSRFYYNDQFMSTHPTFKKRVDADIDSLCILIKMRSVDKVTQDSLVKAIANNSGNASLYRALTDVQRTILNIQTKIEETIRSLQAFMKGYQLEIEFRESDIDPTNISSDDSEDIENQQFTTRGTKDFIKQMREVI